MHLLDVTVLKPSVTVKENYLKLVPRYKENVYSNTPTLCPNWQILTKQSHRLMQLLQPSSLQNSTRLVQQLPTVSKYILA